MGTNLRDGYLENIERETGCEPDEIAFARRVGVRAWHLHGLRVHCFHKRRLLILRAPNPASRAFHLDPSYKPKPPDVKGKTSAGGGFTMGRSAFYPQHIRFISDYDIMSYWQIAYRQVRPLNLDRNPTLLHELNLALGEGNMFQHGANDDYRDASGNMLNPIKPHERFVAFDDRRQIFEVQSAQQLKAMYAYLELPWPPYPGI